MDAIVDAIAQMKSTTLVHRDRLLASNSTLDLPPSTTHQINNDIALQPTRVKGDVTILRCPYHNPIVRDGGAWNHVPMLHRPGRPPAIPDVRSYIPRPRQRIFVSNSGICPYILSS